MRLSRLASRRLPRAHPASSVVWVLVRAVLIIALLGILSSLWFHLEILPDILENTRSGLERRTGTSLTIGGTAMDLWPPELHLTGVKFAGGEHQATIDQITVTLGAPQFWHRTLPLKTVTLTGVTCHLTKEGSRLKLFPDFLSPPALRSTPRLWKFPLEKLVLREVNVTWRDRDVPSVPKLNAHAPRLLLFLDPYQETIRLQGGFRLQPDNTGQIYLDAVWNRFEPFNHQRIEVHGQGVRLPLISPYQFPVTHLQLEDGFADFHVVWACYGGKVSGDLTLRLKGVRLGIANENLLQSAIGLTSATLFTMIRENRQTLDLDFLFGGTRDQPILRLGPLTREMMNKAPVVLAKDSVKILENTLEGIFIGIPRLILSPITGRKEDAPASFDQPAPEASPAGQSLEDLS